MHLGFACPTTARVELPWVPDALAFPAGMTLPTITEGRVGRLTRPGFSMPE